MDQGGQCTVDEMELFHGKSGATALAAIGLKRSYAKPRTLGGTGQYAEPGRLSWLSACEFSALSPRLLVCLPGDLLGELVLLRSIDIGGFALYYTYTNYDEGGYHGQNATRYHDVVFIAGRAVWGRCWDGEVFRWWDTGGIRSYGNRGRFLASSLRHSHIHP